MEQPATTDQGRLLATDSLTTNQRELRQISVSQMADGKDETWSPAKMSVARRWPWSVVADCSMPMLQPQETRSRRELINGLMAPALSGSRQSTDGDEQQCLMSATGCQPDMPVLYRVHSGMLEHTTGTGFAPERVTSATCK